MPSAASCALSGPGPSCQDTRRDWRAGLGRGGLRPPAGRERRTLGGFFDAFAWREPGQVRFYEAKVGPDRIKPTQRRFIELALRFHRSEQFMIIEVSGPSLRGEAGRRPKSAWEGVERDTRRPTADKLRLNRQGLLRRTAGDLLRMLDQVGGPDEPETRLGLRDVAAAIEARRGDWPPDA